jgi:membrane-bound serine protease (ClpP class)
MEGTKLSAGARRAVGATLLLFPVLPAPLEPPQVPAEGSGRRVIVVPIEGPLDATMLALLRRGSARAEASTGSTLLVQIDTEGGEVERMWEIARAIDQVRERGIPTVGFVSHRAWSAGVLVALACGRLYASPRASIGAATPVVEGPVGIQPLAKELKPKVLSAFRADFRAFAEGHGRDPRIAEAMVDPDLELKEVLARGERRILRGDEIDDLRERGETVEVLRTISQRESLLSLTAREALEFEFVDGIAADRDEVLQLLGLHGASVEVLEPTWSERFAEILRKIGPILFVAGCILAYVEMKMPGFGIPGALAVASFALLLFGNYLAGLADALEIVLVLGGMVLLALEIFAFPGTLFFGILGVASLLAGIFLSFQNFVLPQYPMDWVVLRHNVSSLVLCIVAVVGGAWLFSRYLPHIPFLGRMVLPGPTHPMRGGASLVDEAGAPLVGRRGRALTDLRPAGKIEVEGRLLDAQTEGEFLAAGTPVRVMESGGNRIVVGRSEEPPLRGGTPS